MIALFSVDLAYGYHPVSPYTYCMGNPIKFVDPNGKKIVDAQGNLLYHEGKWTDAAQGTAAMVVGNAIMKTNVGRILWNRLSDAKYGITIELNPGIGERRKELGRTDTYRREDNGKITSVKITIYEGSIAKQIEPQYTSEQAQRLRSLSEEDRIGDVGVHEATHAVDDTPHSDANQREANARAAEKQHVRELDFQKTIIHEGRNLFDTTIKFKNL